MSKSFNWSLLDRNMLFSMLHQAGSHLVTRRLTVDQIFKILSKHVKEHLPVKVTRAFDESQTPGYVYIGGTYYAGQDELHKTPIELVLSFRSPRDDVVIKKRRWENMCWLFADTILHEIVHMHQYRSRQFKTIPGYESSAGREEIQQEQNYYGHKDEIGAFSFNIACELNTRFNGNADKISSYLDTNNARRHRRSTYKKYLEAFNYDHNHRVIKELKKRIRANIARAQAGKPFASTAKLALTPQ